MAFQLPPQSTFFYKGPWTAELDAKFLSIVVAELSGQLRFEAQVPTRALLMAMGTLNQDHGAILTTDDIYSRYEFLQKRYKTFKELLKNKHTYWDMDDNWIIATDEAWKRIFKGNELMKAYYRGGEPEFNNLSIVFGFHDIKTEGHSKSVINISEDEEEEDEEKEETVTSPPINARRRYLFNEERHCPPAQNAFPRRPNFAKEEPSKSHGQSSCASNSPLYGRDS